MTAIDSLLVSLSTPSFVHGLQLFLSLDHRLTPDGFFGPKTGKAFGQAYTNNLFQMPPEYREIVPQPELCHKLQTQLLKPRDPNLSADGFFGPNTGEALGSIIHGGHHIPRYEPPPWFVEYVKKKEGCPIDADGMAIAYKCPTGNLTIGYGRTHRVSARDRITIQQAHANLIEDLNDYGRQLEGMLTHSIGEGMFWALCDLGYNVGMNWLNSESSALRLTNHRDYESALEWFEPVSKGVVDGELRTLPGLLRRRKDERKWYEGDLCSS